MAMPATISTRERILAIAAELFARHGFSSASLQDVADRLGITKAALYYHFNSKDDILLTVLRPYFEAADGFLARHAESVVDPGGILTEYVDLLLEHRTALDVIAFDRSVLNHPEIGETSHRQTARLRDLLVGPSPTMERQVAAAAALGAVRSATALLRNSAEPSVREAVLTAALAALDTGV
jgi:AcrR family transcriptional regulator